MHPRHPTSTTSTSATGEDVAYAEDITTLDDVLRYIGEFGTYQRLVSVMLIPFGFFNVFVYFSQMFLTLVPEEHWCKLPEVPGMSRDQVRQKAIPKIDEVPHEGHEMSFSRCWMYDVPIEKALESPEGPDPSWPKKRCDDWHFKFTSQGVPYATVASDLAWVCEDAYLVSLAQSIFFVGSIVGGFVFGRMADKYGRVPVLVVTNMFGLFAGLGTIFTKAFWQFSVCRFLVGVASDNNFVMMYILALEYIGPKWRTLVANVSIALCFPTAGCALPWIAFYLANWKTFAAVTSVPLIFALVTPCIVPESVRWLASRGKTDEAIKILKRIARINARTVPEGVYEDFKVDSERLRQQLQEEDYSVKDLFRTPRLRTITSLLIAVWGIISLVVDGHVRNFAALGTNVFLTFTIASACGFPADIFVAVALDHCGRRWLSFGSLLLSGIACFSATLTSGIYFASLGLAGKFLVNVSYSIGLQYAAELLPTVVRGEGVSLVHIVGYFTSILSPFVAYSRIVARPLPMIILGCLSTIGSILCLFLPETLHEELSQTLQEGEEFGRDQRFCDMPCLLPKEVRSVGPSRGYLDAQRPTSRVELLRSSIISGSASSKHLVSPLRRV